jgi:hypothetical protein
LLHFLRFGLFFFLPVPEFLKVQVAGIADSIGMDVETITYVLGLFLCYPLGLIMASIPYGTSRHIFSFLLGAFLLQFVLGVQWIHQLVSSLIAYAMILVLPRKTLKLALPVFAMTYMTLGHLHRQYINYLGWDLDFTGCQMVLTQKLYMIGYNLYDGEQLAKGADDRAAKKCSTFALKETPSLLAFLGYTFCFSSLLAGPATEFSLYLRAVDGSLFLNADGSAKGKMPSNVWPTLKPLLTSLICLGVFVVGTGAFPLLDAENPQVNDPMILKEDFLEKNIFYRYGYMWVALCAIRQKYYFGWKNAEGANNIWYAGFDGFDEKGQALGWETSNNIVILGFEFAPDVQSMTKNWNIKTSSWLTRYVYIRTGGSLLAVYSLSAFWHGFYPGYYMFFFSVPIITLCDRLAKKKISPYFSSSQLSLYGLAGSVLTTVSVNYMISAFIMLAGSWAWRTYKSFYFLGHILSVAFFGLLTVLPNPKKKEKTV